MPAGAQVHQALDVHRHFAAQVALDRERAICERIAVTSASVRSLTLVVGSMPAPRRSSARVAADAVDVGEPDADVLVHRNVDAGYACHPGNLLPLTLPLLVARIVQIT
jgi:hypothetical protein